MTFDIVWVDVAPYLAAETQPIVSFKPDPRQRGSYWVPQGPLVGDDKCELSVTTTDIVRVPMWAYRTMEPALAALFGLGVQTGMSALSRLFQRAGLVPEFARLFIGHECEDLRPDAQAFRCYIGVALLTR